MSRREQRVLAQHYRVARDEPHRGEPEVGDVGSEICGRWRALGGFGALMAEAHKEPVRYPGTGGGPTVLDGCRKWIESRLRAFPVDFQRFGGSWRLGSHTPPSR